MLEAMPDHTDQPTAEQRAVIAACEARYPAVRSAQPVPPPPPSWEIIVEDTDGKNTRLVVLPDGTTRAHSYGGVPTRLYGGLPSSDEKRRTWGDGLPKQAQRFLAR